VELNFFFFFFWQNRQKKQSEGGVFLLIWHSKSVSYCKKHTPVLNRIDLPGHVTTFPTEELSLTRTDLPDPLKVPLKGSMYITGLILLPFM